MRRVAGAVSVLLALTFSFVAWGSAGATTSVTTGRRVSIDSRVALRGYTGFVEQRLGAVLTALSAVASSSDATSGQWPRIRAPLASIDARTGIAAAVWFVEPDGSYYTTAEGLTTKNLSDRSYFAPLMAGRVIKGPLVVSKATGRLSSIVAVPILAGGHVIGGLGASIDQVDLAKAVQRQMAFPSRFVFYAINSQGRCALNKDTSLIFSFPSKLGSSSLTTAVHTMLRHRSGSLSYRFHGADRTVVYMRSAVTGWTFAIGVVER